MAGKAGPVASMAIPRAGDGWVPDRVVADPYADQSANHGSRGVTGTIDARDTTGTIARELSGVLGVSHAAGTR